MLRVGSRAQVMHGNAKMTGGGLKKKDLKYNKQGKIVSKEMSTRAKKEKRLQKAGYTTKKGQFGAVRIMRGGVSISVEESSSIIASLKAILVSKKDHDYNFINFDTLLDKDLLELCVIIANTHKVDVLKYYPKIRDKFFEGNPETGEFSIRRNII
jgi:predicted Zn-dependent protease